jgi:hypothetical protein
MNSFSRVYFALLTVVIAIGFGLMARFLPPGLPERLCTMLAIIIGIAMAPFALLLALGSLLAPVQSADHRSEPNAPPVSGEDRTTSQGPPEATGPNRPGRGRRAA